MPVCITCGKRIENEEYWPQETVYIFEICKGDEKWETYKIRSSNPDWKDHLEKVWGKENVRRVGKSAISVKPCGCDS